MTVTEPLQLYAPLVGLVGVTFFIGVLSEKVRQLAARVLKLEKDRESDGTAERTDHDLLVRLTTNYENTEKRLESMDRTLHGMQRQIAGLMTGKGAKQIIELGDGG